MCESADEFIPTALCSGTSHHIPSMKARENRIMKVFGILYQRLSCKFSHAAHLLECVCSFISLFPIMLLASGLWAREGHLDPITWINKSINQSIHAHITYKDILQYKRFWEKIIKWATVLFLLLIFSFAFFCLSSSYTCLAPVTLRERM